MQAAFRFVSFFVVSLTILCQASEPSALNQLQTALQNHSIQTILGYDPAIEYFPGPDHQVLTLYFHGWNRDKDDVKNKLYFHTPAIIFNFLDASATRQARLCQLSLGQMQDIRPALIILSEIAKSEITNTLNLAGFSRGATTIVNTINVLNNPAYRYERETLGITEPIRRSILAMIQRGTILLDCPLKYARHGIANQVKRRRAHLLGLTSSSPENRVFNYLKRSANKLLSLLDYPIALFLTYLYLPIFSNYKPWREEVFSSLDHWQGLSLTTIIRYEKEDPIVGNAGDTEFYEKIRQMNPNTTHLIISDSCGHCSPDPLLAMIFNRIATA